MNNFPVCKEWKNSSEQCPILIHQTTQERSQNSWSPKNITKGSEFLIPQTTRKMIQNFWSPKEDNKGFRIWSPKTTGKDSVFKVLIPQRTEDKIQNFWSPTTTHKMIQSFWSPATTNKRSQNFWSPTTTNKRIQNFWSPTKTHKSIQNFWSPKEHRRRFRISDPLQWHTKWFRISDLPLNRIPNFLSPTNRVSREIRISDHPTNPREKIISLPGLKAVTKSEVKVNIKGFWSKLFHHHKFLFNHESYYQCTCSHIKSINIISLKTWFRTCCLPEQCLIKIFFLDNNNRNFMQVHYVPYTQIIMREW